MAKAFLSCKFKIHNPSRWRKNAMDEAISLFEKSFIDYIEFAAANQDHMRQYTRQRKLKNGEYEDLGDYNKMSLVKGLPAQSLSNYPLSAALKEGARVLAAQNMVSYFNQPEDGGIGFPSLGETTQDNYLMSLDNLASLADNKELEDNFVYELNRQARFKHLPVEFGKRRYCNILASVDFTRFYAFIPLLAKDHPLNKKTKITNLVEIQDGEIWNTNQGKVLLPLELGKRGSSGSWQRWKFLDAVSQGHAEIKTSKLIKTAKGEYFLIYSFAFEKPVRYKPETWIGVDVGILYSMSWALIDNKGAILKQVVNEDGYRNMQRQARINIKSMQQKGRKVTVKNFKGKKLDTILHILTNEIIDNALKNKAGVILEDLNIQVRGRFNASCFKKMETIIKYKADMLGIPVRSVFAAYSSAICIHCGEDVIREPRDTATCKVCGKVEHADSAAAVNIARRALYKKAPWAKKGGYRGFHKSFSNGVTTKQGKQTTFL